MDAIDLMELLKEIVQDSDDARLFEYVAVDAAEAGLPAAAPAFVLHDRFTGRQWVVSVAALESNVIRLPRRPLEARE